MTRRNHYRRSPAQPGERAIAALIVCNVAFWIAATCWIVTHWGSR